LHLEQFKQPGLLVRRGDSHQGPVLVSKYHASRRDLKQLNAAGRHLLKEVDDVKVIDQRVCQFDECLRDPLFPY
jgi:hypothetical protein